ncbi:MAG: TetR/AcrR family transcriptional regulator [Chloroflexota bacterium]|nr:TetR/AcrR family transcriptional regulator [Chloroflexota bacterium]
MPIEYAGRGDPARTLALLWKTAERPTRGPKPGLALDQIVAAAIAIADAEGLDALSMRRVASELGVGTMTLYRYVPSKGELLDVMLDTVAGEEPPLNTVDGNLRATLECAARSAWDHFHRHPWILQVAIARPVLGPHTIRRYEAALQVLSGLGLSYAQSTAALMTIDGFVRGVARSAVEAAQAERVTGITDDQWWGERDWFWERFFDPALFPTISRAWQNGEITESSTDPAIVFEFGLARLLDGFDMLRGPDGSAPDAPGHIRPSSQDETSARKRLSATTDPTTDE